MEKIVKITAYSITNNVQETARESMIVSELIEKLQEFPLDARVVCQKDDGGFYCCLNSVSSFMEL